MYVYSIYTYVVYVIDGTDRPSRRFAVYAQYKTLLIRLDVRAFVWAGLLARLAVPMMGIGIITLLVQWRESYALAGAVSATFVLMYAVVSPYTSRWVDSKGQRYVLPRITLLCVSGGGGS